jgi:predicted ribosome quality control (RQC) complex YloA/Tae2 family protein
MNNFQNDTVSTHLTERDDMWFHVKNYHGSHVVLKASAERPFSDEDIEEAACYAAYYSEVKDSEKVEVDFTPARFIKKPNGSKPGFITYKNHKTALVSPRKMK